MTDPKKRKAEPAPAPKKLTPEEVKARSDQAGAMIEQEKKRMEENGMNIRSNVLFASLIIEQHIGTMLLSLMQVTKPELVNINFNQKIEFLEAMEVIDKGERQKLEAFKYVRNKFVHELPINTFVKCFEKNQAHKKLVLELAEEQIQILPDEFTWDDEKRLYYGFNLLASKITDITEKVMLQAIDRGEKRAHAPMNEKTLVHITENIYKPFDLMDAQIRSNDIEAYSKEGILTFIAILRASVKTVLRNAAMEGLKLAPTGQDDQQQPPSASPPTGQQT